MRRIMLASLVYTLAITGCSSGGGSSDSSSSAKKGTGYLKIELPELPSNSASGFSVGSMAQVIHEGTYAEVPSVLREAIADYNTSEACVGGAGNIPFVICIVESLGINAPGTYRGLAPNNLVAEAVVSDITGDPDGYTLQAEVTMVASSEKVFRYKATADGKKGSIEMKPSKIFSTVYTDNSGIYMVWDTNTSTAQTLEYTHAYSGTDSNTTSEQQTYIAALMDATTGVADIASRYHMFVNSTYSGFEEANSRFSQTRMNADRAIVLMSSCTEGTSPVEGVDCFDVDDGSLNELSSGAPLTCGTIPTTGTIAIDVLDAIALSNSTQGSYASTANFSDAQCESLRTDNNGSDAFAIRLDKDASVAADLNGVFHVMRAKTYADLKLLASASFLN